MNNGFNNGSEKTHPILQNVRKSPLTAALISKLIDSPKSTGSAGIQNTKQGAEASMGDVFNASMKIQREIQNSENALLLFPDIELSKQILITGVISPNNMLTQELIYSVDHPLLPPDVTSQIIRIIEEEVDSHYKISSDLYKILSDCLFDKGSHVRLVLPESAVDELINERPSVRFESVSDVKNIFKKLEPGSTGVLGAFDNSKPNMRFESVEFQRNGDPSFYVENKPHNEITITDNFYTLRSPYIQETVAETTIRDKFAKVRSERYKLQKVRAENAGGLMPQTQNMGRSQSVTVSELKDSELKSAVFKSNNRGVSIFARVPDKDTLKRHSIGRPMAVEVPPEAFIPIHYPGDPSRTVGGFAITDQNGYFLTMESQKRFLDAMGQSPNSTVSTATGSSSGSSNLSASLTAKAKQSLSGNNDNIPLTYISEIFDKVMEENLTKRIKNGVNGLELSLTKNNDAYSMLLARAWAGQSTRLVYIPKQFYTYFAFQFNPNGTGRSLLTDVKYLISLRAVSLYAKVANQIRNAISVTDISVKIDERDPDPQKSLEKVVDIVSQTRSQFFPWGLNTPSDIANWWQRAGFQLNVEEHPKLPKTKIGYEFRNHDKGIPNIDDDETLNDMIHMHFGVTPEMRDAGQGSDFATSIANNNILFSKRTQRLQNTFNEDLSDYTRVICLNDAHIYEQIRDSVTEKWGEICNEMDDKMKTIAETNRDESIESFVDEVIASVAASLPSPRVSRLKQQIESFNEFVDALNNVFEVVLGSDTLSTKFFGRTSEDLQELIPVFKSQIVRDWMQTENFMPEVFDLTNVDSEGNADSALMDAIPQHYKSVGVNLTKFITELTTLNVALTSDIQKAAGEESEPEQDGDDDLVPGDQPEEDQSF